MIMGVPIGDIGRGAHSSSNWYLTSKRRQKAEGERQEEKRSSLICTAQRPGARRGDGVENATVGKSDRTLQRLYVTGSGILAAWTPRDDIFLAGSGKNAIDDGRGRFFQWLVAAVVEILLGGSSFDDMSLFLV